MIAERDEGLVQGSTASIEGRRVGSPTAGSARHRIVQEAALSSNAYCGTYITERLDRLKFRSYAATASIHHSHAFLPTPTNRQSVCKRRQCSSKQNERPRLGRMRRQKGTDAATRRLEASSHHQSRVDASRVGACKLLQPELHTLQLFSSVHSHSIAARRCARKYKCRPTQQ